MPARLSAHDSHVFQGRYNAILVERDSYVLELARYLDDPMEVNRLLREVAKFYDPMTGNAMIDGLARQRIVGLIERGDKAEALAAIDRYIEDCQRRVGPDSFQQPAPG